MGTACPGKVRCAGRRPAGDDQRGDLWMEAKEEIKLLGGVREDDAEGWRWGVRWRQMICCGDP